MSYTERNAARIKLFDRIRIWRKFFFQCIFSIEMSYTEWNGSKSNGLTDGPYEKASFLIPFVNRDELYWAKRFKNQTCKKDFFQILFRAFRPVSLMKNTYVFFKYKASFLINFVNRDELYWAKRFKNQTVWQNLHLKNLLFLIHFLNRDELYWAKRFKIKRFGGWPIWKSFFSNPFCQSRWAILSETIQKSNV